MEFTKTTEQHSKYDYLEKMTVRELLNNINKEDKIVPIKVEKAILQIEKLVLQIIPKLKKGGRIFYIGSGTSGRLGILDASECPPTFGIPHELVVGVISGGDIAIKKSVEKAEDCYQQGWIDLQKHNINPKDVLIGIAASGTTPYVLGAIQKANENKITTGCITMNENSPLHLLSKYPVVVVVGPEFITGSSRMKAGTAQKLILNMISTSVMIKLGKVKGNKMVDMKLSNNKLTNRGIQILMDSLNIDKNLALNLIKTHGSVRKALNS